MEKKCIIDAKEELTRTEIKKKVNKLIKNPRNWWKTANDVFEGKTPQEILEKNPEQIERMIYFLESGEPG